MNFRRVISAMLVLIMSASLLVTTPVNVVAIGGEVVASCASYVTNSSGEYYTVNLDEIIESGNEYEISFNVKPNTLSGSKDVFVDVSGGDIVVQNVQGQKFGLLYVYDSGNNTLGLGNWNNIGVTSGYKESILSDGIDMNIVWDTKTGNADIKVVISEREYNFAWDPGVVTGHYGNFKIGADSTTVSITDFVIKTLGTEQGGNGEVQDEIISSCPTYVTSNAADYYESDLDAMFETGYTYEIVWNMKPTDLQVSNAARVDIADTDAPGLGQYGLFYLYENSDHALGMGDWNKVGYIPGQKTGIAESGIDFKLVWDTETGTVTFDVMFPQSGGYAPMTKSMTWEPGVIDGNYGRLLIGADATTVTITDFKVTRIGTQSSDDNEPGGDNDGEGTDQEPTVPTIYTEEKGWILNGGIEQADGSLKVPTSTAGATVFKPALEAGKKYSITYDVTGLTTGDEWAFPFRVDLSAGEENVEGVLSYRMSSTGRWNDSETDRLVAEGTNGKNEIVIYTATGEWEAYALGNLSKSGTFADVSDFTIKFYQWAGYDAYISNVTVTELGDPIYTEENGWTVQDGAEQADGTLRVPINTNGSAIFKPTLEAGKKYSITYDVTGLTTGDEWAYPFIVDLSAGEEVAEKVLSYRMSSVGRWNNIETDALVAEGTDGKNEIVIDTATGEWETYALGNLSVSGTFANVRDFSINFYQWAGYPAYISNVQVKEISQTVAAPVVKAQSITFEKYDGEKSAMSSIVYAGTKQITIDFGTKMNFSSLNAESVVLKEKESGNVIAYGADRTATAYKMIFDNLLKPGCSYVLTISGTVANASDITLGETVTFEFTTDEGDYKFTLNGISVGDNSNPTISDVVNSNSFTTNIGVINSTGITKDMLLITTYYKGDRLLYAKYDKVELDESYINTVVKRESNTVVPEGTDNIRIFLWDQFNTMNPYDTELVIK